MISREEIQQQLEKYTTQRDQLKANIDQAVANLSAFNGAIQACELLIKQCDESFKAIEDKMRVESLKPIDEEKVYPDLMSPSITTTAAEQVNNSATHTHIGISNR